MSTLTPACYTLEHIGQTESTEKIRSAICRTLGAGVATPDLGGSASTDEVTRRIVSEL